MKVRIVDGYIRAIGKQLAVYDAFDVGAFVCGPALFDAVEKAAAGGDSSLAGAIQVLADAGSPVRCPSATTSGGSMSTRRATNATAAATSFGSRGSRSMAPSPPGSTAPSRSGWSPRAARPLPAHHTESGHAHRLRRRVAAAAGFAVGAPIAAACSSAGQRARRQRWRGRPAHLSVVPVRRVSRRRARPGGRRHRVHRRGDLPRHRHPGRPARRAQVPSPSR